jgi:hypothetical protein
MTGQTLYLEALTPEAEQSLGGERLALRKLPFRVGRECRLVAGPGGLQVAERRRQSAMPSNDLYLIDPGPRLQVSRAHFQIEADGKGGYRLLDRGSACGTIVGNQRLGGDDRGGEAGLADGDLILVGTSESPFAFRFRVGG